MTNNRFVVYSTRKGDNAVTSVKKKNKRTVIDYIPTPVKKKNRKMVVDYILSPVILSELPTDDLVHIGFYGKPLNKKKEGDDQLAPKKPTKKVEKSAKDKKSDKMMMEKGKKGKFCKSYVELYDSYFECELLEDHEGAHKHFVESDYPDDYKITILWEKRD